MKLKHNKKRNTAFLYEVLVRNLTKAVIDQDEEKKSIIVSIVREHFSSSCELKKELSIYQSLTEKDELHPFIAEKIVYEAKRLHENLDQEQIFNEQNKVINKINKALSKDAFNVFVPNYKSLASIYQIFDKTTPIKTKVILEGKVIKNMIGGDQIEESSMPPVDNLVYHSFVKKFNSKYGDNLLEEQKQLLNKYIVSFTDNCADLKVYLSEEISRLQEVLSESVHTDKVKEDEFLAEKIQKVQEIIEDYREASIDEALIGQVLKMQKLVKELQ